jgi:hypothetical protein
VAEVNEDMEIVELGVKEVIVKVVPVAEVEVGVEDAVVEVRVAVNVVAVPVVEVVVGVDESVTEVVEV